MNDHRGRRRIVLPAVATLTLLAAGCGSTGVEVSTHADEPVVITADQVRAATGGRPAIAVGHAPRHGTLVARPGGTFEYRPEPGYLGTDHFTLTTDDAVRLYTTELPPLGTFGGTTVVGSGFGSAWTPVPGSADEFYGLTDRGPNVDGPGKDTKLAPIPSFVPAIGRFRLVDGRAELTSTIPLRRGDGTPFNGQVDRAADTGETIKDLDGNTLPPTDHGLDPEGLVALPDGTFWVSDEYGPFLVHVDAGGREIERLAPGAGLPAELALRTPNQGMEGLTITPDGHTLVGIMQSALKQKDLKGSAKDVPMTRIVTVDLRTKAVHEYLCPLTDPKDTKVADSEITALSPTTFLVDERDGKLEPKANKKLWTVDIAGATDVGPDAKLPGSTYDPGHGGLLVDGHSVEALVGPGPTAAGSAALQRAGITPAAKRDPLDLGALVTGIDAQGRFFGHDKIEGVATTDGGRTLYISNDSDFGLGGSTGEAPPFRLTPKTLPDGEQDNGEILQIDTSRLPGRAEQHEISVRVG